MKRWWLIWPVYRMQQQWILEDKIVKWPDPVNYDQRPFSFHHFNVIPEKIIKKNVKVDEYVHNINNTTVNVRELVKGIYSKSGAHKKNISMNRLRLTENAGSIKLSERKAHNLSMMLLAILSCNVNYRK